MWLQIVNACRLVLIMLAILPIAACASKREALAECRTDAYRQYNVGVGRENAFHIGEYVYSCMVADGYKFDPKACSKSLVGRREQLTEYCWKKL
jgi:hypothetical protein